MCIIHSIPLQKRPLIQGMFGALFGIASVVGPLIGGAFTSNVTWRWCFYINLPIGGVAMVFIAIFLKAPENKAMDTMSWQEKLKQLDFLGTICLVSGMVCLILALQWGGQTYPVSHLYTESCFLILSANIYSGAMVLLWLAWFLWVSCLLALLWSKSLFLRLLQFIHAS